MTKQFSETENDTHDTLILSQISHEISNPLTLIYSTIQLLAARHPELGRDDLWSQLVVDVDYLKQLTASLLTYSRCAKINAESTDMNRLLVEIAASWKPVLQRVNKRMMLHIPKKLPEICCDPLKIKQCLINLIKNSSEATSEHDIIKLSARTDGPQLVLTVADTGRGMDASQLKHIFDPFVSYKSNGNGLGLAVTRRIIEAHHGTLEASSVPGRGSKFIIRLPLRQPENQPLQETH